jgi:regulator-associated protein of mTOR
VTSLATDSSSGTLFATGHADGSLHIFDTRLRSGAVFRKTEGHRAWIEGIRWQRRGRGMLVSGSRDGRICVWDVRKGVESAVMYPQTHPVSAHGHSHGGSGFSSKNLAPGGIGGMAVHEEANVIVTSVSGGLVRCRLYSRRANFHTVNVGLLPLHQAHGARTRSLSMRYRSTILTPL